MAISKEDILEAIGSMSVLDLSELKNAIYFLNVTNGKGSYFQKIVKL